jgi:putative transposase
MTNKQYSSDLTPAEWQVIEKRLPEQLIKRKRKYELRILFNAMLYVLKNGCVWRDLPKDYPPYGRVFYYLNQWKIDGTFDLLHEDLHGDVREHKGKQRSPSLGIIDAQSTKTTAISSQNECGYDAGKKIKGRKRHIMVDTMGLLILVVVTSASVQDRDGAKLLLEKLAQLRAFYPRLKTFIADQGYQGPLLGDWFKQMFEKINWIFKVVKGVEGKGFQVVPKRWIVERTFSWIYNSRRLAKDYERCTDTSELFIKLAMIRLMAIRLAK